MDCGSSFAGRVRPTGRTRAKLARNDGPSERTKKDGVESTQILDTSAEFAIIKIILDLADLKRAALFK